MKRFVTIVTDSTCDLCREALQKYGIEAVPLRVSFGDAEYSDGGNLTKERFYELLNTSSALPVTSQPPPSDFFTVYDKLKKKGVSSII